MFLILESASFSLNDQPFLQDFSFSIESKNYCFVKGKNGVGKTTLLKILSGITPLSSGKLTHIVPFWYKGHGFFFEDSFFVKDLLIREHKRLKTTKEELTNVIDLLDLRDLLDKKFSYLSQGQKQRFSFLGLFLQKRPLWILDEPFTFLDVFWKNRFKELFQEHLKGNGAIIAAHHQTEGESLGATAELFLQ